MSHSDRQTAEVWTRRAAWALLVASLPLMLLDWPIRHDPDYHPHFACERWFGFFCGVGAVTGAALVGVAKIWRRIVFRAEDRDCG